MRILQWLIITMGLLSLVSGCSVGITGHVIDAETLQPIEGAVVLVEWTKTHGIGLTYTESYKAMETISDKDGKVKIPGCYNPFVNEPDLTVYKEGYVAWNNNYIFPQNKRRQDFVWRSGILLKLEKFLNDYSYINHESFIYSTAHPEQATEKKTNFLRQYRTAEGIKVSNERKERDKSREVIK